MKTTLYAKLVTVLYADGTDPQVLDAQRMPSRVVASTPTGPLLKLIRLTGKSVEVKERSREAVHRAALKLIKSRHPKIAESFTLVADTHDSMESIPRGNLYIEPFGDELSFGFPVAWKERDGEENVLVQNPPSLEPGQPRVWARYNLVLSTEKPGDPTKIPFAELRAAEAAPAAAPRHGREAFLIEGEGVLGWIYNEKFGDQPSLPNEERAFRFCRMFGNEGKAVVQSPDQANSARLGKLARAMSDDDQEARGPVPAGYNFFGQFITHELTHDRTAGLPASRMSVNEIEQGRSPRFDLDSLYGKGPAADGQLYAADHARLKVGETDAVGGPLPLPSSMNDLPRQQGRTEAILADARNDSNLGLAQMHVAFLRLHNHMVQHFEEAGVAAGEASFAAARTEMRRCLQAVTLYDYLPRICDPQEYAASFDASGKFGAKFWRPDTDSPAMPIEFSVAAFRLGHSMVANEYDWNDRRHAGEIDGAAHLQHLFAMTGRGGLGGHVRLPQDWVIDWQRFLPMHELREGANSSLVQHARKIRPYAASGMHALPGRVSRLPSLAKLNLMRGERVGLISGQEAAMALGVEPLSSEQLCQGAPGEVGLALSELGFDRETPLWVYILREAELLCDGAHLGPVGSRIVLDTMGVLIGASEDSVMHAQQWVPALGGSAEELQLSKLIDRAMR